MAQAMIRCSANGVVFYRFESLARHPEIRHGIFTRLGGASTGPFTSLNLGHSVGDDPDAVEANHALVSQALGLSLEQFVTAHQVHGRNVVEVGPEQRGKIVPDTDALITDQPGIALLLRFADCLPLLLYAPSRHAIGIAHAGWRGVVAGIVPATVAAMQRSLGCDAAEVIAALGPAIGPCCYRVGQDVGDQVALAAGCGSGPHGAPAPRDVLRRDHADDGLYLDLPGAVRCQLKLAGVSNIEASGLCTGCHRDEFFSHRADGGRTGRFAAVLALS